MTDPNEGPGILPRAEFANSGGSQFFISLSYAAGHQLDRRYTAFGRIVDGVDVLRTLSHSPLQEGASRPRTPVRIVSAHLAYVSPGDNPYARLKVVETPAAGATTRGVP